MDTQNAAGSATMKPVASPRRDLSEKPRDSARSRSPDNQSTIRAASPRSVDDGVPDQNSDAETIVLPGKDGISPSKPRKVIKHEDKSDGEMNRDLLSAPRRNQKDSRNENTSAEDDFASAAAATKRKRLADREKMTLHIDGSSGLSSAPTSPPSHRQKLNSAPRRRIAADVSSESESEPTKHRHPKIPSKDKARSVDRHLPSGKRKIPKTESDDEADMRKARRPRISDASLDPIRGKDSRPSSRVHNDRHASGKPRSISPQSRSHRRSASSQLPSQSSNGFGTKKRRIPAPLQSTDYNSDDSSASGSPHPRSSRLKNLSTPMTGDSTNSPAKSTHYKRHVDNHGQTQLAKACAKGEYDLAKRRLAERPEDINFADYAGNTPLQIASLAGHESIVELLISAGCKTDCRNSDKETPLLDAVENGHLGVVKILLDAGVNPRKADAEGHEPLEKVPDDVENAEEIRAALQEAKDKMGELRRTSEDHLPQDLFDDASSRGQDSPRRSPPQSASGRRGGNVRSTKTSNHLLYMPLDEKTLRLAAGKGDEATVTRVLQVKENFNDPESLVAAARGGHNVVMELLLALGGGNPDPAPVEGLPSQYSTPILAAIGQENTKTIRLLLEQNGFDPTRRFKGETYYEIARRREGPAWKEEETILKDAYDSYKKSSKGSKKPSPGRREREADSESKRDVRNDGSADAPHTSKRRQSSPTGVEIESKKKQNTVRALGSPKEKRRSSSFGNQDDQTSPKRGPGRPKKDERSMPNPSSDREQSPASSRTITAKPKRADSELVAGSSDGDTVKRRRKLISGSDLKGEREKERHRRASLVSNNSTDRGDAKTDDGTDKRGTEPLSEKYHDRTKALKRDDSRDRMSPGDGSAKRQRSSMTPPRNGSEDKDDGEAPVKRRKLDVDARDRRRVDHQSPDGRAQRDSSREPSKKPKPNNDERKDPPKVKKLHRKEAEKSVPRDKPAAKSSVEAKDVHMRDAPKEASAADSAAQAEKERKEAIRKRRAELAAAEEAKKQEEEKKRKEEEARKKREAEEQREREAEKKRAEEQRIEEERKRKEAEEKEQARLEEEKRQREERERKQRAEEEEAKRQLEEAKRKQQEEEERKRKEKEEALRLEKEAAEEARRIREEEEQQERERKQAAAREAERVAELERQESLRRSKLPPLLRWLDLCPDPKRTEIAKLFSKAQGVRYDTIDPTATGKPGGLDLWLLNTQVALLLGEKDLSLSNYSSWERKPASIIAKRVFLRLETERYALTQRELYGLGTELVPDYYGGDPREVGHKRLEELKGQTNTLFFDTDLFFIKLSDFLSVVPTVPHLREVKLSVHYRELPETVEDLNTFSSPAKWKRDPGPTSQSRFGPRYKFYVNGQLVSEEKPGRAATSRSPFPDLALPRRGGLTAVQPGEPDYARLCMEQGLGHLLSEQEKQMAINGAAHLTPRSMGSHGSPEQEITHQSPTNVSPHTTLVNGTKGTGSPESQH